MLLVRHAGDAEDVVQEACVVAVRRARDVPDDDPWPWFAAVVRNVARNTRRGRSRAAARREELVHDPIDPTGHDPAQEAETRDLAERAHAALTTLPEREREAIVLVHLAGLTVRATADVLSVAPSTVSDSVQRGLGRLRGRLRAPQKRIVGALAALPLAVPAGGAAALVDSCLLAARDAATHSTATSALVTGGALVSKNSTLALSVALSLAIGAVSGIAVTRGGGAPPDNAAAVADDDRDQLEAALADARRRAAEELEPSLVATRRELDATRAALATAEAERDRAARKLASVSRALADARAAKTARTPAESPTKRSEAAVGADDAAAITFGAWSDVAGEVDWAAVATDLQTTLDSQRGGSEVEDDDARRKRMQALMGAGMRLSQTLRPLAKSVGENPKELQSHPVLVANVVHARLQKEEKPLVSGQRDAITALGERYAASRAADADGSGRRAHAAEVRRRHLFVSGLYEVLAQEQRDVFVAADDVGLKGLDPFAAANHAQGTRIVAGEDDAAHIKTLRDRLLVATWGLSEEQADEVANVVRDWVRAAAPHVADRWKDATPFGAGYTQRFSSDAWLAGSAAQEQAVQRILATLVLEDAQRERIANAGDVYLLRRPE